MKRAAMLAVLVAAIVVAFVIAKNGGSGNDKSTTNAASGAPVVVHVVNGQPQGGIQKITVNKGQRVRFRVVSDVADEIHVHGYDFHKDVKKGGSVSFDFPATIDGIFDVELESRSEQIASLQVNQ
jgi:hypothetical protein